MAEGVHPSWDQSGVDHAREGDTHDGHGGLVVARGDGAPAFMRQTGRLSASRRRAFFSESSVDAARVVLVVVVVGLCKGGVVQGLAVDGHVERGLEIVVRIDLQVVDDGREVVHAVGVPVAVLAVRERKVHVQLVHAGWVVHVGHDLLLPDARLLLDGLQADLQHLLEHGDVLAPEVAQRAEVAIVRDGEPVEHALGGAGGADDVDVAVVAGGEAGVGRAPVAVDPLRVREEDELAVAVNDLVLLLRPVYDVADPLLAGTGDLLLYEPGDARARVQGGGLCYQSVISRVWGACHSNRLAFTRSHKYPGACWCRQGTYLSPPDDGLFYAGTVAMPASSSAGRGAGPSSTAAPSMASFSR